MSSVHQRKTSENWNGEFIVFQHLQKGIVAGLPHQPSAPSHDNRGRTGVDKICRPRYCPKKVNSLEWECPQAELKVLHLPNGQRNL